MNKINIYLIMLLFCIVYVSAIDICINPVVANQKCFIVTPQLVCDNYSYSVYDNSTIPAPLIDSGIMGTFINGSYYFNFSQPSGTYYIKICDGSTRQIDSRDNMIGLTSNTWFMIIFLLLFIVLLFLSFKVNPLFMFVDGLMTCAFGIYVYSTITQVLYIIIPIEFLGVILGFIGIIGFMTT